MTKQRFKGKVAWITGGGSGIGKALALELAAQGADVAVSGRRADRLDQVVAEIESLGRHGLAVPLDVTDDAATQAAVAQVVGGLGRLDVAVANAGVGIMGLFGDLDDGAWQRILDINVRGVAATCRHALPALRKTGGRIVMVASVAGFVGGPASSAYSASKFALRGMGLSLSQELHGSGVSCTLIHPGFVTSEINQVDNAGVHHADRPDNRPSRLVWPADRAARVMARAIHRRKREFVFTGHGRFASWVGQHFPGVAHFLGVRFARKGIDRMVEGKTGKPALLGVEPDPAPEAEPAAC